MAQSPAKEWDGASKFSGKVVADTYGELKVKNVEPRARQMRLGKPLPRRPLGRATGEKE